jgi:hypothetical protein
MLFQLDYAASSPHYAIDIGIFADDKYCHFTTPVARFSAAPLSRQLFFRFSPFVYATFLRRVAPEYWRRFSPALFMPRMRATICRCAMPFTMRADAARQRCRHAVRAPPWRHDISSMAFIIDIDEMPLRRLAFISLFLSFAIFAIISITD